MGCIESKKIIESLPNSDINTVYHVEELCHTAPRSTSTPSPARATATAPAKGKTGLVPSDHEPIVCEMRVADVSSIVEKIRQERQATKHKYKTKYDPRIIAKYELKGLIGEGTFSKVIRVENRLTKEPYAIKVIESREGREAFEAELSVLRRVKCKYIIQLVEVFESTEKIYMVMELATGGDLFDKIMTRGPFSEGEAAKVLRMVLEGVKYLHNLGITHRDLKPDNLLYYHPGTDSKLLITDFGLAHIRKSPDDVFMSTICGTPEYIAPEMVGRRRYTSGVDVWAVGVITYILLRGDFPFYHPDRNQLYRKIHRGKYTLLEDEVSEEARDFVHRLLTAQPDLRPTAAEALQHTWIRTQHSGSARGKQMSSPSGSWGRSSRSSQSSKSAISLRTARRRVLLHELENLDTGFHNSSLHYSRPTYMSS
ncbi:serine/threonine-protein kinase H1-like [Oratosquilla oratoria]|uniref:serine/threonine-protein kinase H1-like n=1 Tax=Oratosquilla oratoria TaxID=337810 RepID=UPI003F7667AE